MRGTLVRTAIRSALLATLGCTLVMAQAQATARFDLPAQPLAESLKAIANQTRTNVLFDLDLVKGLKALPLRAQLTPEAAVAQLLAGTGVLHELIDEHTIVLTAAKKESTTSAVAGGEGAAWDADEPESSGGLWNRLRLAQSASATGPDTAPAAETTDSGAADVAVDEVVVTAQKRLERLLDVPVPVTSLSAATLIESNQTRLQDYYTRIPGLSFTPRSAGEPTISIRGVTADYGANPAVGITVDDVPYGASTGVGGGLAAPDFDPNDLARIEVLRGPQGTLYGASSLGGLLKFVSVDPSTDELTGRIQGGLTSVGHAEDLGYSARAGINVPLGDSFAVRASGFVRRDAGYIDNVRTGRDDINATDASGGRLLGLWRISDSASLKLGALIQHTDLLGSNFADLQPGLGDLQQNRAPGTGRLERDTNHLTANFTTELGSLQLTALSGYGTDDYRAVTDIGVALDNLRENTKFSQEVRLSSQAGERLEWLAGAFYTHERTPALSKLFLVDPATGAFTELFRLPFRMTLEEYAGFADLTVHLSERFDVQLGGRQSWIQQDYTQGSDQPGSARADAFTYMLTPRLKLSPDSMVYVRVASGYRAGGPNTNVTLNNVPRQYDPDKTVNYEIGFKGALLDRALTIEASVYHIDWNDLQLVINGGTFTFFTNAGKAKSEGVELSVEARPLRGLRLAGWVAYNDAELTENFPAALTALNLAGRKGDRIPDSADWSGHFSIQQEFALPGLSTGSVGAMVSYVGDRRGPYVQNATAPRQTFPHYTQLDLSAGVRIDTWAVNLSANNVTDKRAVLTRDPFLPTATIFVQPRTIALTATKTF